MIIAVYQCLWPQKSHSTFINNSWNSQERPATCPQRNQERPPLSVLGTPRAVQLRRSSPGAAAAAPRRCLSPAALVRMQARDSCLAGGRATRASTSAWMVGRCQPVWAVTAGLDGVTRRSAGHRAACWLLRLSGCHHHPGDPAQPSNSVLLTDPATFPSSFSLSCLHAEVETRGAPLPLQLRRSSRHCPLLHAAASHPLLLCACRRETAARPVAGLLGRQRRRGWLVAASLCGPLRPALKA